MDEIAKVLLRIDSWDDEGRPRTFTHIRDTEVIDLGQPENKHFISAMVDPVVIEPDRERIKQ